MTKATDLANAAKKLMKEAGTLVILDPEQKHLADPKSFRKAVNLKCWDCQGRDSDPGVKSRIGNCPVTKCGLWTVRPYQP